MGGFQSHSNRLEMNFRLSLSTLYLFQLIIHKFEMVSSICEMSMRNWSSIVENQCWWLMTMSSMVRTTKFIYIYITTTDDTRNHYVSLSVYFFSSFSINVMKIMCAYSSRNSFSAWCSFGKCWNIDWNTYK